MDIKNNNDSQTMRTLTIAELYEVNGGKNVVKTVIDIIKIIVAPYDICLIKRED